MGRTIEQCVQEFTEEVQEIARRQAIEAVEQALAGGGVPARAKRAAKKPGAKRSPKQIQKTVEVLLGYIKKHKGERIEQIGKGLGIVTKDLNLPVEKLLAGKKIKSKGRKRATRYFPA